MRDLLDVSTDIQSAAVVDASGAVVASGPGAASSDIGAAVTRLWDVAAKRAEASGETPLDHVLVSDESGSVAALSEHGHRIVACTGPQPAVGLLLFDLRTCLGDAFAGEDASTSSEKADS